MAKKKCPICGKSYRNYISHIWTHKKKTVAYLQRKRKQARSRAGSKRGSKSKIKTRYCPTCGKKQ